MKKFLLLLSVQIISLLCLAEAEYKDYIVRIDTADTEILSITNDYFNYLFSQGKTDELYQFTSNDDIDSVRMNAYFWAATILYDKQEYDSCIVFAKRAAVLSHQFRDTLMQSDSYNLIAISYFRLGQPSVAAVYADSCYQVDYQYGDLDRLSSTYNSIAAIYVAAKMPKEAIKYIEQGIEIQEKRNNPRMYSILLGTASEIYLKVGESQKSLDCSKKAFELEKQLGCKEKQGVRLAQMASAYIALAEYDKAYNCLQEAIPLLKNADNQHSVAICFNLIGNIHLNVANSGKIADKNKSYRDAAEAYAVAAEIFRGQGDDYNEAFSQHGIYESLKLLEPEQSAVAMARYEELASRVYNNQTSSELAKYNAIYNNDLLVKQNIETQKSKNVIIIVSVVLIVAILLAILFGILFTWKKAKRTTSIYSDSIADLNSKYEKLQEHYNNALQVEKLATLSIDEKYFFTHLAMVVDEQLDNGEATVESVASKLCLSPAQLRRRLSQVSDETPQGFILNRRMLKARHLLDTRKDLNIAQIALMCGYEEKTNFSRAFKNIYGITPTDYQHGKWSVSGDN